MASNDHGEPPREKFILWHNTACTKLTSANALFVIVVGIPWLSNYTWQRSSHTPTPKAKQSPFKLQGLDKSRKWHSKCNEAHALYTRAVSRVRHVLENSLFLRTSLPWRDEVGEEFKSIREWSWRKVNGWLAQINPYVFCIIMGLAEHRDAVIWMFACP